MHVYTYIDLFYGASSDVNLQQIWHVARGTKVTLQQSESR